MDLDDFINVLQKDFSDLLAKFKEYYGGHEGCINACRIYGVMEFIHNKIEKLNKENNTDYLVPELPKNR